MCNQVAQAGNHEKLPVERQLYAPISNGSKCHCVTVKMPLLVAVPPGVVIAIFPVFAPVGT